MTARSPGLPPSRIQSAIESICELGCDRVNEVIAALESGDTVAQTKNLDAPDQQWVLKELKAIMAVYDSDQA